MQGKAYSNTNQLNGLSFKDISDRSAILSKLYKMYNPDEFSNNMAIAFSWTERDKPKMPAGCLEGKLVSNVIQVRVNYLCELRSYFPPVRGYGKLPHSIM